MMKELEGQIGPLGMLADPSRRSLYLFVAGSSDAVSRDQASRAVGISRSLAAYHLDLLVEEGLLEVEYQRLSGRRGPGAGRTAKLYRRSSRQIDLSLPARRYQLAGEILAGALERFPATQRRRIVGEVARAAGFRLASGVPRAGDDLTDLTTALLEQGYEPTLDVEGIQLRNCPFHLLVEEHRDLVCSLNLELLDSLLAGLGVTGMKAVLDPGPGRCCVRILSAANG